MHSLARFCRCCHRIWWIIRSAPANARQAGFVFTRLHREVESFTQETLLCTSIHLHGAASSLHSGSTCEGWRWWHGITEHFPGCPSSGGSAGRHRRSSLPIAVHPQLATSRLHERHSERYMGTHKMIVGPPPFYVNQQVGSLLCCGPGAFCQS